MLTLPTIKRVNRIIDNHNLLLILQDRGYDYRLKYPKAHEYKLFDAHNARHGRQVQYVSHAGSVYIVPRKASLELCLTGFFVSYEPEIAKMLGPAKGSRQSAYYAPYWDFQPVQLRKLLLILGK